MKTRVAVRGFTAGALQFEYSLEAEIRGAEDLLPALAAKHPAAPISHALHMIEIEFLDEPDPMERFFRFGTDPRGMAMPIRVDLPE